MISHLHLRKNWNNQEKLFYFVKNFVGLMIINNLLLGIFGGQEIFLVLIIALVLFGGAKIPELMRGLGKGINEFKKAKDGLYDDLNDDKKPEDQKKRGPKAWWSKKIKSLQ